MQNTPSRRKTDIQCAVFHWKDKPRLFATLRAEKRYFAPQTISVLTARSESSSPDSTRRQEALRRRFGRRTKAPWHSCGDSNLPQWPTDCRKPVEARTSHGLFADERASQDYVLSHTKPDIPDVGLRKCTVNPDRRGKGKMPWACWIFASA